MNTTKRNIVGLISALAMAFSLPAFADDKGDKVVGMKLGSPSNSGPTLMFDVAEEKDNNYVGIRGEVPLTEKDRAMQNFRERMGQRTSVEVYGQVELGYQYHSN